MGHVISPAIMFGTGAIGTSRGASCGSADARPAASMSESMRSCLRRHASWSLLFAGLWKSSDPAHQAWSCPQTDRRMPEHRKHNNGAGHVKLRNVHMPVRRAVLQLGKVLPSDEKLLPSISHCDT